MPWAAVIGILRDLWKYAFSKLAWLKVEYDGVTTETIQRELRQEEAEGLQFRVRTRALDEADGVEMELLHVEDGRVERLQWALEDYKDPETGRRMKRVEVGLWPGHLAAIDEKLTPDGGAETPEYTTTLTLEPRETVPIHVSNRSLNEGVLVFHFPQALPKTIPYRIRRNGGWMVKRVRWWRFLPYLRIRRLVDDWWEKMVSSKAAQ